MPNETERSTPSEPKTIRVIIMNAAAETPFDLGNMLLQMKDKIPIGLRRMLVDPDYRWSSMTFGDACLLTGFALGVAVSAPLLVGVLSLIFAVEVFTKIIKGVPLFIAGCIALVIGAIISPILAASKLFTQAKPAAQPPLSQSKSILEVGANFTIDGIKQVWDSVKEIIMGGLLCIGVVLLGGTALAAFSVGCIALVIGAVISPILAASKLFTQAKPAAQPPELNSNNDNAEQLGQASIQGRSQSAASSQQIPANNESEHIHRSPVGIASPARPIQRRERSATFIDSANTPAENAPLLFRRS